MPNRFCRAHVGRWLLLIATTCTLLPVSYANLLIGANSGGIDIDSAAGTGGAGADGTAINMIKFPKQSNKQPLPDFTVVPLPEYNILKSKALTLTCRARFASSIQVICGGEELDSRRVSTRHVNAQRSTTVPTSSTASTNAGTGPLRSKNLDDSDIDDVLDLENLNLPSDNTVSDSAPTTEVQWNVTSVDVEEYGGTVDQPDFTCECVAWRERRANILPVRTNQSRIVIAYLKKNFQQQPIQHTVKANQPAELPCMPPEGKPMPEVSWLKNGKPINLQADSNLLIGGYGSLMINQARESDSGLYTCVAQNVAGRRLSEAANLTVTVDGRWSDWTPWNPPTCASRCTGVPVIQSRNRICFEAKNGGIPCNGSNIERRHCPNVCPVDGEWSDWSVWEPAKCDKDCKQYRDRACNNPSPARGGNPCDGPSREERLCDDCIVSTEALAASGAAPVEIQTLLIYVAAACGIAVTFATVTSIYCLRKRKLLHVGTDSFGLYVEDSETKRVPCIAFRKSSRSKEHRTDSQTQAMRLLTTTNQEILRSPTTITLNATPGRNELAQLSMNSSSFQHPECSRSTTYLTSLTPTRSVAIASTQMPTLPTSIGQPFAIEKKLTQSMSSDLKLHSTFSSPHTYQSIGTSQSSHQPATISISSASATLTLPPPPPPNVIDAPHPQSCALHVPAKRIAAAPLTTNMVSYHDCMMNSFVHRPVDHACESSITCTSANEPMSCDDDAASRVTPYCATSQCESACACGNEHDDPLYATFADVMKTGTNQTPRFLTSQYNNTYRTMQQQKRASLQNPGFNETAKSTKAPISVCVPDGALLPACASIGVATIHEDIERPPLRNDRQTFLSAVTQLRCTSGHRAVTLVKTVVLSFPHCALLNHDWQLSLHFTHDHLGDAQSAATWHSVPIDRENGCAQINESGAVICCHVDANRCYVVTNRLGRYALIGEPVDNSGATKMLRLAAFSTVLSAAAYEHTVRVYILDDMFDALQQVLDVERAIGGCLLDSPKQLAFKFVSQQSLRVQVDTLSLGWRAKSRMVNCQQEIPFSHIWAGTQTRLHCSFMFERCLKAEEIGNKFLCKLTAFQPGENAAPAILNVVQECSANIEAVTITRMNISDSVSLFTGPQPVFTATVRRKLSALLDDDALACNWKELATQLGIGTLVTEQFASLSDTYSPAETLLSVFEAKCAGSLSKDEALQEMASLLRRMKRPDCAVLLENDLSNKF